VKLFEVYDEKSKFYMVMELMTGGEVNHLHFQILKILNSFSFLTESWKRNITVKKRLLIPSDQSWMPSDIVIPWALPIEI